MPKEILDGQNAKPANQSRVVLEFLRAAVPNNGREVWSRSPLLCIGMLLLSGASVGSLLFYLKTAATLGVDRVAVEKISGKDADAMSYIVTYLIPFLDIKIDEPSNYTS